jgi:hypothetical protein
VGAREALDLRSLRAALDHRHQLLMLVDRHPPTRGDEHEDRAAQRVQPLLDRGQLAAQVGVRAALGQRSVEGEVVVGDGHDVERLQSVAHPPVDRARLLDVLRAQVRGAQRGGVALEHRERAQRLHPAGFVERRDLRALVALVDDPALGLEPPDRLAHRHRAHVEVARQRVENQPLPGAVRAVEYARAQDRVGALLFPRGGHWSGNPSRGMGWSRSATWTVSSSQ